MKIDFYILDTTSNLQANVFACKLLEKIYVENQTPVYIHVNSRDEAERLDNLLWTYRDDSFIPHQIYSADNDEIIPILIGHNECPANYQEILLNFSQEIPGFYQQFKKVIEIVFTDSALQSTARERYKQYRDAGHELNTIKTKCE